MYAYCNADRSNAVKIYNKHYTATKIIQVVYRVVIRCFSFRINRLPDLSPKQSRCNIHWNPQKSQGAFSKLAYVFRCSFAQTFKRCCVWWQNRWNTQGLPITVSRGRLADDLLASPKWPCFLFGLPCREYRNAVLGFSRKQRLIPIFIGFSMEVQHEVCHRRRTERRCRCAIPGSLYRHRRILSKKEILIGSRCTEVANVETSEWTMKQRHFGASNRIRSQSRCWEPVSQVSKSKLTNEASS